MLEKKHQDGLRVIIVGGSIAGLVLAHSLYRAGIDFVVLEARERIDPQVGASIGLFANGARILDQLGVYDDVEKLIDPPEWLEVVTGEGQLLQRVDHPQLMNARDSMGYPISFLERQQLLKILFDHFPDQTKVFTNKKVTSVETHSDGVVVSCADGSEFYGGIVAGADGVHSKIRQEMWRYAGKGNSLPSFTKDKKTMSSEYRCLFGISSSVPGLQNKTHYRAFNKDWSFLVIPGQIDRCFWFVFEKLDKIYYSSNIPRYTKAHEEEFVSPFMKRYVSEHVTFDSIWTRRICTALTALQEAQYSHWTLDRFVCLGDSIHKMTPNIGQGGNWAIESAAALANNLEKLSKNSGGSCSSPSIDDIRYALKNYEQSRQARTRNICETANFATRLEAFSALWQKWMFLYLIPSSGDITVDVFCNIVLGAERLDFLPLPENAFKGTMPFQTAKTTRQNGTSLSRAFWALPLLGLFSIAYQLPGSSATLFLPTINGLNRGEIRSFILFMGGILPLQIIWTIESSRRGNAASFATLSTIFLLLGQWKGFGLVAPVFFFLHYIQSSLSKYSAPDNRLTPLKYAKTLVAAIGIGFIIPTTIPFLGVPGLSQYYANIIWQLFPLWAAILHRLFASLVTDTTMKDRIKNPSADMPYLRQAYGLGASVSGIAYLYLWITATGNSWEIFPGILRSLWRFSETSINLDHSLLLSNLISLGSGCLWELLHFHDLKRSERLNTSWAKVLGILGSTAVFLGPGAAMVVGWAWREEVLAGSQNGIEDRILKVWRGNI